jgi:hypothetical protein
MSDPREREPEPIKEPIPPQPEPDEDEDEEPDDLVARAANRAKCTRMYPDVPCISILAADNETVVRTEDCVDWCPVLNARV